MRDRKWATGLSNELIKDLLDLKPKKVSFHVVSPNTIKCRVELGDSSVGVGLAICSVLDKRKFSVKYGKRKAARRAFNAILRNESTGFIRDKVELFPPSWIPSQRKRVIEAAHIAMFKSAFIPKEVIEGVPA